MVGSGVVAGGGGNSGESDRPPADEGPPPPPDRLWSPAPGRAPALALGKLKIVTNFLTFERQNIL